MSLSSKQLFIKSTPSHFTPLIPKRLSPPITSCHLTNNLNNKLSIKPHQNNLNNVLSPQNNKFLRQPIKAHKFDSVRNPESSRFIDTLNFLNLVESVCVISSAMVTAFFAAKCLILGGNKWVFTKLDYRVLLIGVVMHVIGTMIGVLVRRRECGWGMYVVGSENLGRVGESVEMVKRVEDLEGELGDVVKVNRSLARQLEKLGVRFRVTRRSLKDPIDETAAFAQKNLEAQRALALQISVLEEEIGESQKAMLAMQEQQHKQLELILAMGKALKLLNDEQGQDSNETQNSADGDPGKC